MSLYDFVGDDHIQSRSISADERGDLSPITVQDFSSPTRELDRNCTSKAPGLLGVVRDSTSEVKSPMGQRLFLDGLLSPDAPCKNGGILTPEATENKTRYSGRPDIHEAAMRLSQGTEGTSHSQPSLKDSQKSSDSSHCVPLSRSTISTNLKSAISQFSNFRAQKIIGNGGLEASTKDGWDRYMREKDILRQASTMDPGRSLNESLNYSPRSIRMANKKMKNMDFKKLATLMVSTQATGECGYGELNTLLDRLYETGIVVQQSELPVQDTLIHWKTKISRKWSSHEKIWLPCKEYDAQESVILVLLSAEGALDIVNKIKGKFVGHCKALQDSLKDIISPAKVIYLIQGLGKYKNSMYYSNSNSRSVHVDGIAEIEDAFIDLQMEPYMCALVNLTHNLSDTVEYLAEATKQIALLQENRYGYLDLYRNED